LNNISETENCQAQPFGENQSKTTVSPLCFENFKNWHLDERARACKVSRSVVI
jgi:hypothetical protein